MQEFKNVGVVKKTIFAALVAFLLSCACSNVFAAEHPWELKKDEDGIQVHVRPVEGSDILEYKGVTVVDAGLDALIAFYEKEKRMPEWFHQCVEADLLEAKTPALDSNNPERLRPELDAPVRSEEKVLYFVISMPWPVKDRDSVYRRIRSQDPATGAIEYKVSAVPNFYPEQKGRIRMPYLKGFWRFTPLQDGRTEVYYQQHSEVGGHIPAWLVNKLAVNIPFESLDNFRRILTAEKTTR
jgi:hypothetical protein